MLKFRLISFPLLLLIFFLMLFWQPAGSWIFMAVATGAMVLLSHEFLQIVEKMGLPVMRKTAITFTGITIASYGLNYVYRPMIFVAYLILLIPMILLIMMLFSKDKAAFLKKLFATIGAVYLLLLIYLPLIAAFPMASTHQGPYLFLFLVLVTKAMDTGGYVFGLLSNRLMTGGNHKIAPTISPKKSWEGFFGGIFASVLVAFIIFFCCNDFAHCRWWNVLILAVILAVGSFFGDLTESAVKRAADIKDSASYIPGMGGVFDVLDSFIYNGWLWWILMPALLS